MFVNISNGNVSCRVSKGAFDNYYKSIGYSIIDDNVSHNTSNDENVTNNEDTEDIIVEGTEVEEDTDVIDGESEDDKFIEEIMETPISKWTNEEMKRFVTIKGIDTSSVKKASEVRNIIKEYLINEEKNKVAEE
jgi:hypothetical protein